MPKTRDGREARVPVTDAYTKDGRGPHLLGTIEGFDGIFAWSPAGEHLNPKTLSPWPDSPLCLERAPWPVRSQYAPLRGPGVR